MTARSKCHRSDVWHLIAVAGISIRYNFSLFWDALNRTVWNGPDPCLLVISKKSLFLLEPQFGSVKGQ